MKALTRRRSRRDALRRGSSGARWSSVSGSRTRGSISVDLQQRAVAAEPGAERRQPPPAAGRVVGERRLRARSRRTRSTGCRTRAASPRCSETPAVVELEALLEREQHVAAAGMHDPGGDVARHEAGRTSTVSSTRSAYSAASAGTSRREDVAQHALALLEHQRLALRRARSARRRRSIRCGASAGARPGSRESTAAPAPSPNRQALISTPGSLSRYIAALLTSTQTESTWSAAPAPSSERPSCRFGSAAAQPWPTRSNACTSARRPSRSTT